MPPKRKFKRECTNQEASGNQNPFGNNNDYYKKALQYKPYPKKTQIEIQESSTKPTEQALVANSEDEGFDWNKYIGKKTGVALMAEIINESDAVNEALDNAMMEQYLQQREEKEFLVHQRNILIPDSNSNFAGNFTDGSQSPEDAERKAEVEEMIDVTQEMNAENLTKIADKAMMANLNKVGDEVKVVEKIVEKEVVKVVEVVKPCTKCTTPCDECIKKDQVICELNMHNENFRYDYRTMKEAYDKMKNTYCNVEKANLEQAASLRILNATLIDKQESINMYINTIAETQHELQEMKIETERVRQLLLSYTSNAFVIDYILPTVKIIEKDDKTKVFKRKEYGSVAPPLLSSYCKKKEEGIEKATNLTLLSEKILPDNIDIVFTQEKDVNEEIIKAVNNVLDSDSDEESFESAESSLNTSESKTDDEGTVTETNLSDDLNFVMYKLKDSDRLYFYDSFPIQNVKEELIDKFFKLVEVTSEDQIVYERRDAVQAKQFQGVVNVCYSKNIHA